MTKYTASDHESIEIFSEAERASFAEKSASLVQGRTEHGLFEGDSLEEIIAASERQIHEAQARQAELGDVSDYVAERRARIELCKGVAEGRIDGKEVKF